MPIYNFKCVNGHERERFYHTDRYRLFKTEICDCGEGMTQTLSMGRGLTWFEEGRGRWIENLGDDPVYITSHGQHRRIMKEQGVVWATPKRGMPGCWA